MIDRLVHHAEILALKGDSRTATSPAHARRELILPTRSVDLPAPAMLSKATVATVATVAAVALTRVAGAAGPSHSGTIEYLAVEINNGKGADIVTGPINAHGTDRSVSNTIQKIVLPKGTFEADATKLNKNFKFRTDPKACTAVGSGSAKNLPISHGTGAYAAITGSIVITINFSEIASSRTASARTSTQVF